MGLYGNTFIESNNTNSQSLLYEELNMLEITYKQDLLIESMLLEQDESVSNDQKKKSILKRIADIAKRLFGKFIDWLKDLKNRIKKFFTTFMERFKKKSQEVEKEHEEFKEKKDNTNDLEYQLAMEKYRNELLSTKVNIVDYSIILNNTEFRFDKISNEDIKQAPFHNDFIYKDSDIHDYLCEVLQDNIVTKSYNNYFSRKPSSDINNFIMKYFDESDLSKEYSLSEIDAQWDKIMVTDKEHQALYGYLSKEYDNISKTFDKLIKDAKEILDKYEKARDGKISIESISIRYWNKNETIDTFGGDFDKLLSGAIRGITGYIKIKTGECNICSTLYTGLCNMHTKQSQQCFDIQHKINILHKKYFG